MSRDLEREWRLYRAWLRIEAPDITDEDIQRLWHFLPTLTPIALAIRRAFP